MTLKHMFAVAIGAALLVVVAGCGGRAGVTNAPQTAAGPTPAVVACTGSGGTPVTIADNTFTPSLDSIGSGESVTWTNTDQVAHTVTFYLGPDCGTVNAGATLSATLSGVPGEYRYHCTIHASMSGSIRIL